MQMDKYSKKKTLWEREEEETWWDSKICEDRHAFSEYQAYKTQKRNKNCYLRLKEVLNGVIERWRDTYFKTKK